jgi:mono/diheme cytochrome c family protein
LDHDRQPVNLMVTALPAFPSGRQGGSDMEGWRFSAAVALLVSACCGSAFAQPIHLSQGWDAATSADFWFRSQGSRIMPYSWFIALEQADNQELLRAPAFMERLGYIVVGTSPSNPHNLPIGFARDENTTATASFAGLTCAACHTAQLLINNRRVIVDGGPAMADFTGLLQAMVDSTTATIADPGKFSRFATNVGATTGAQARLKADLIKLNAALIERRALNAPADPYGFGRVDAFGHIFNRVLATAVGVPTNGAKANAPVSYPFLWDTPQHDRVQWNGSAPNDGLLGLGALFRNIGELLGVFGQFDLSDKPLLFPFYAGTSVRQSKLNKLEGMVKHLYSPAWPEQIAPTDDALVSKGKPIYETKCASCHVVIRRTDPNRYIQAQLFPVNVVETDDTMAKNFVNAMSVRDFSTGMLQGRVVGADVSRRFESRAKGLDIFTHVLVGVYTGQLVSLGGGFGLTGVTPGHAPDLETEQPLAVYKARPLNGVWATAPFLHNGSVPTLWELLKPADKRVKTFSVGPSVPFDPVDVGLAATGGSGSFLFDTSRPGNGNGGHPWGTGSELSDADRRALIEYIKKL